MSVINNFAVLRKTQAFLLYMHIVTVQVVLTFTKCWALIRLCTGPDISVVFFTVQHYISIGITLLTVTSCSIQGCALMAAVFTMTFHDIYIIIILPIAHHAHIQGSKGCI